MGHRDSRHDIFVVVHADKTRVFRRADGRFNAVFFYYHRIAAQEHSALELFRRAEEYDFAARGLAEFAQNRVVVVEHAEVVLVLILGYRFFYRDVVFERLVPVEMVGRDVENSRDMRLECHHSFKLEAAYLRDRHAVLVALERVSGVGDLDVADEQSLFYVALHYVIGERSCRGLAVCACYADNRALVVPVGKLDLAPDRYIMFLDGFHYRRLKRYAGAYYANVNARKIETRKIAEDKFYIIPAYFFARRRSVKILVAVVDYKILADFDKQLRGVDSAAPRADYKISAHCCYLRISCRSGRNRPASYFLRSARLRASFRLPKDGREVRRPSAVF